MSSKDPTESTDKTIDPTPAQWHRNAFAPFKKEILTLVIYPKVVEVIHQGHIKSKSDLLIKFKETYDSHVSMTTFDDWLSDLGITFERVTKVNLPSGMTAPIQRQSELVDDDDDPIVRDVMSNLSPPPSPALPHGIIGGHMGTPYANQ